MRPAFVHHWQQYKILQFHMFLKMPNYQGDAMAQEKKPQRSPGQGNIPHKNPPERGPVQPPRPGQRPRPESGEKHPERERERNPRNPREESDEN